MHKRQQQTGIGCGIDVSARELVVAWRSEQQLEQRTFPNRPQGHRALLAWLRRRGGQPRICLEATGIYSLDIALALAAAGMAVAVLNPRAVSRFAETLRRSKTDAADAQVLAEYARRMPFQPWQPPRPAALQLRAITRHRTALNQQHTMQQNRLRAAQASATVPRCVRQELERSLRHIEASLRRLQRAARQLVDSDPELQPRLTLLLSLPGVAEASALHLLAELSLLPHDLDVRQWVAHSGLDPRHHQSGSSVHAPSRISRAGNRHLRLALYMPALVAVRHDPHLRAFYQLLLQRRKAKLQALVAVARKMLHAIFGMFRSHSPYDGARLLPQLILPTPPSTP